MALPHAITDNGPIDRNFRALDAQLVNVGLLDVRRYGAKGDGVADDRPAIQAAIDATNGKGIVYLPLGTYYLGSVGPLLLPPDADGLTIRGAGEGCATLLLSSTCAGAFYFDRSADADTFQNITLEDFTVDANSITSERAAIIGTTDASRAVLQRINMDNITVRRITSVNVPVDRTLTDIRRNITLCTYHPDSSPEATQSYLKNILVEDVTLNGGIAGVEVFGTSANTSDGTNIYIDNIVVNRARHTSVTAPPIPFRDTFTASSSSGLLLTFASTHTYSSGQPVTFTTTNTLPTGLTAGTTYYLINVSSSTARVATSAALALAGTAIAYTDAGVGTHTATTSTAGSSVHIGSLGFGGTCRVRDCYSQYSGDVGVEINAMTDAVIEGCQVDESAGPSFYHTHYNYPALGGGSAPSSSNTTRECQRVLFTDCHARRVSVVPVSSQSGFRTGYNRSIPLGTVVFRDCSYFRQGTSADCQAEAIASIAPARAFIVDGFHATVEGMSTGTNTDEILVRLRDGSVDETILRNIKLRVQGERTANSPKVKGLEVGTGSFTTKLLIDNFSIEFDLTTWTGPAYGMLIGNDTATLTGSEISRVRLVDWAGVPGSAWQGIYIGDSNLTITDRLLITNCDLINAGAGGDIGFTSSPTNIEKVYVRDIDWSSTPPSSAVASAATITLPLGRPFYTITGTTGISSITASYVDHTVCLKFTDAAPGTVTDGSNLNLAGNFTPTTSDTLTLVCDGTNWNEIARSVN